MVNLRNVKLLTLIGVSGLLLISLLLGTLTGCNRGDQREGPGNGRDEGQNKEQEQNQNGVKSEVILGNLDIPWSIAFLPDNDAIITERNGSLSLIKTTGNYEKREIERIEVNSEGEGGLLGLTVHPRFHQNRFVYIYFTYRQGATILNRVERYKFAKDSLDLTERTIIIENIPGSQNHNGGRIKFGPDDKLYITTGDAQEPDLAQNLDSTAGKILRLNDDGNIPEDNPFEDSAVFSYGHRNPQGLAWHPETNRLYATEHGPSANDELNEIEAGKNYGWPDIIGESKEERFVGPILSSRGDTWAPSGVDFYRGSSTGFTNNLFFAALRGEHLHRVSFGERDTVNNNEKMFDSTFGRLRDVVSGPDNSLYLLTNNRDGRGDPQQNDDRLIKITLND